MALVDVATAKVHLRVTHSDEDARIESMVAAAQEQAEAFLNRRIYEDTYAQDEALTQAPAILSDAEEVYDAALEAAGALESQTERNLAETDALAAWKDAQEASRMARRGMVVNESIRTAILLITASLWEHRGDEDTVAGIPPAARAFLWPYRIGLGV